MDNFEIKHFIEKNVLNAFNKCGYNLDSVSINTSSRPELCDYQCNECFTLSKLYTKNPQDIALEVIKSLGQSLSPYAEVSFANPAFINFKITNAGFTKIANILLEDNLYLINKKLGNGKTIVIDYGGANIAKELHMGHLRSPIIGESVKNLFKLYGYETISDVHLGDWGLQMGLIIAMLDEIGSLDYYYGKSKIKPNITLDFLNEYYPKASAKSKVDKEFKAKADDFTLRLQRLEEPFFTIWKDIWDVSVKAIEKNYKALNCHFDLWYGESTAHKYIDKTVDLFIKKGLTSESDGALIVDVKKDGEHIPIPKKNPSDPNEKQMYKNPMPPLILKKHNGGDLYATTDIATILQRVEDYPKLSEIIYFTDKRQGKHFEQVFRASRMAGIVPLNVKLIHMGYGTMNGKDGKPFKTRSGETIKLQDIINLLTEKATQKLIANGTIYDDSLALQIGVGAMKFGDLINDIGRDYVFDMDNFLSFEGKTGPYIQYTAVRIKSILDKAGKFDEVIDVSSDYEKNIIINVLKFISGIDMAFTNLAPNYVCIAVYNLASSFSTFYNSVRILTEKDERKRNSYLSLCKLVYNKIKQGLDILAIDVPNKM